MMIGYSVDERHRRERLCRIIDHIWKTVDVKPHEHFGVRSVRKDVMSQTRISQCSTCGITRRTDE